MATNLAFFGIKGTVVALARKTGTQVWTAKLKGGEFVNLLLEGDNLYATTRGEIFCLNPETGTVRWHNPMKGLGTGLVSICAGEGLCTNPVILAAEGKRRDDEAAAVAGAGACTTYG